MKKTKMAQLPIEIIRDIFDVADLRDMQRVYNSCTHTESTMKEVVAKSLFNRKHIDINQYWTIPEIEDFFGKCKLSTTETLVMNTREDWDYEKCKRKTHFFPNLHTFIAPDCGWIEHRLIMPNLVKLTLADVCTETVNKLVNMTPTIRDVELHSISSVSALRWTHFGIEKLHISRISEYDNCDGLISYLENVKHLKQLEFYLQCRSGTDLLRRVANMSIKCVEHLKLSTRKKHNVLSMVSFPELQTLELISLHGQKSARQYLRTFRHYPKLKSIKLVEQRVCPKMQRRVEYYTKNIGMRIPIIYEERKHNRNSCYSCLKFSFTPSHVPTKIEEFLHLLAVG